MLGWKISLKSQAMVWLAVSVLAGLIAGGSGGPAMAVDLAGTAPDSTYVMVVYGDTRSAGAVFPLPTGTVINCTNTSTGAVVAGPVLPALRGDDLRTVVEAASSFPGVA